MMEALGSRTPKRPRHNSLLGLALEGSRLEGALVRRTNGSLQVQKTFSAALSLDPLTSPPELVGREIRNHLDAAGVRERCCVLGLPLKWALTTHVEAPELSEADLVSFLQIEAERGFPCDPGTLQVASSRCQLAGGRQSFLLVGMPRTHLATLEQVMRAAKLKPVSFALSIAALQPPALESAEGVLTLAIGENQVGLEVTCGGGVAALRALEGALETEGVRRSLKSEVVAREARITLGQLPHELRDRLHLLRVFGPPDLARQLTDEMELRLEAAGLKVDLATQYAPADFGLELPPGLTPSAALSLAARPLSGQTPAFEFLPPRLSAWQQVSTRYSSGKLRLAAAAAIVGVIGLGAMLLYQQLQLAHWQRKWLAMAPKVQELERVQQQIRQYRPWYDEAFRSLTLMKQLTQAFPEEGYVSAKTVEIRDPGVVTCTGQARDYPALLKTLDRLRSSPGIMDVRLSQIRGKSPMQFTFDFRYAGGGSSER
jgi:hypothetical protein